MDTDLFSLLKAAKSVARISNFYLNDYHVIEFISFSCPRFTGNGLKLNECKTGFTATYRDGFSANSLKSFELIQAFNEEFGQICQDNSVEMKIKTKVIFADADSVILLPIPVSPPAMPPIEDRPCGIIFKRNLPIYREYLAKFGEIYQEKPWKSAPKWALEMEYERLDKIIPSHTPEPIKEDFINRCFAGFALDGIILREGRFGPNPVILGVESKGVSILQNSALAKKDWIPVIDLC